MVLMGRVCEGESASSLIKGKEVVARKFRKRPEASILTAFVAASIAMLTCYSLDTVRRQMQMRDVELLNAVNTCSPDATRFLTVKAICNTIIPIKRNLVASLLSSMKLGINESLRLANIVPGVFRRALNYIKYLI